MNAAKLSSILAKKLNIRKKDVNNLLKETTEIITEQLSADNIISIHNFGTLELKKREERISFSPTTGERTTIPSKLIVSYKVSTTLKEKIKES